MSLFTFNEDAVATLRRSDGTVVADTRDMFKFGKRHEDNAAKGAEEYAATKAAKAARKAARDESINNALAKSDKEFGRKEKRALNRLNNDKQGIEHIIKTKDVPYKVAAAKFYKGVGDAANSGDVSGAERAADEVVDAVKDCNDQSWLEKQKAKLEAKIKEYDNKFKKMEEENKKNGGSSIGNKLKWVFTKIKQLFLKLIKAIVSALASIQNKFRSKK